MIKLNNELFIYNKPMIIFDRQHIIKLSVNLNDKQKGVKPDYFFIQFSEDIPSNVVINKNALFGDFKIDNDYLKTVTTKTIINPFDESGKEKIKEVYYPNMCLLKTCTIKYLKYMLAYQFGLNISNIHILFDHEDGKSNLCSNNDFSISQMPKNNIFHHDIERTENNMMLYDECVSIGENFIMVIVTDNTDNKLNNYEDIFYKDYYQSATYVKKLLTNLEKQKVSKYNLHMNIAQMVVTLIYAGPKQSHSNINIAKLFNLHHVGRFSKIYVHSNDIDSFQANPRPMQYVKVHSSATNVFKGISSLYNTCSLYWGLKIGTGLSLNRIEVQSNMTINFVFTNINSQATYDELSSKIKTWIDDNYAEMLRKIKLWECIYNVDFNYKYYVPYFNGISASTNVNNVTVSDIDALNEILLQETCKLKFRTRTSLQMNGYGFNTLGSYYKLMYLSTVHEFITSNIIYKDMLPTIHVGLNGTDDLTITVSNSYSYNELIFSFGYILSIFNKINDKYVDITKSAEMNIESIRKHSTKYGKNLLKILERMDPRLFGPRKIGKNYRSFSGLCQKHKQRAVPITMDEYEYLRTIVPDSVTNLRNQTYPEQRVYLFCPYKKYSFLNYHIFPNQLCIVRCTTKPSNKTQYTYCATSLDAEYMSDIQNKYENQTITLYNPLITKGRKCRLPDELKLILVSYILLKLNINVSIYRHCSDVYNKNPFIIRRDPNGQTYSILTEYNEEFDYVLILQSELNEDYFLFLNEDTGEPLVFSKNEEIKRFFMSNVRKTNSQYNFFNFLEKLFKTTLNQHYEKIIKDILNIIKTEFDVKFIVHDKFIRGVLWKNCICLTPKFYWIFDESDISTIPLFKAIEFGTNGKYRLPSINMLDEEYVGELYRDYQDKKIHMVNFHNVPMLVDPFEISAKWGMKDIIIFDSKAALMNLYNINISRKYAMKSHEIKILNVADVINNYIFIYMMENNSVSVNYILIQLKALNIVYEKETFIEYTDSKYKTFVSWRSSKINENDFNEYFSKYANLTINDNIKNIYKKFQEDLEFKYNKDEVIKPKIITS